MVERRDYVALDWVAGEIEETLKQASQALDAYIANRDDATKLRFCLTHIHQVLGTLRMVEFFGAALLAEEMEFVTDALAHGRIHEQHIEDALSVLKTAMAQLPRYLDRVKKSRHGLPALLLPTLNDLRAVRGGQLLSETVLFSPTLQPIAPLLGSEPLGLTGQELTAAAQKLRQMYQISLLGFIRGKDLNKNLNYLAKVCARFLKLTAGQASQPLWRVSIAVLEGLLNGSIESSVAVQILLRQIDRQIKQIVSQGEEALIRPYPEELVKNLLYYVACSKAESRFIKEVKEEFDLANALLGSNEINDEELFTPSERVMALVVEALAKELGALTQTITQVGEDSNALVELLPKFKRIADTLAILGLGNQLKQFQQLNHRFNQQLMVPFDTSEIAAIKQGLLAIHSEIAPETLVEKSTPTALFNDSEEAQEHLDKAHESVIRESRTGLELAKDAVIEFVATHWDHQCLAEVPAQLQMIIGSLKMMSLNRPSEILTSCKQYIAHDLLTLKKVPDWQVLDTLADALTSVDYYLERLTEEADAEASSILDMAANSVAELGYPIVQQTPVINDVPLLVNELPVIDEVIDPPTLALAEPPLLVPSDETHIASEADNLSQETLSEPELSAVETEQVAAPSSSSKQTSNELSAEDIPLLAQALDDQLSNQDDDFEIELEDDYAALDEPESALDDKVNDVEIIENNDQDDEEFDPEIAEIFVEEAGEVLETIAEYFPKWQANHHQHDARDTVRRAYHTLKGSGRMVGAMLIGELAWSIESLLNGVIDDSVVTDQPLFDLIAEVTAYLPNMVSAFEQHHKIDPAIAETFMARAESLMHAEQPSAADRDQSDIAAASDENSGDFDEQAALELSITHDDIEALDTSPDDELDAELLEIFASEASVHKNVLDEFIQHCHELAGAADLTDNLQRALHTLKGSANMAAITSVARIVGPVEGFLKDLRAMQMKADAEVVSILEKTTAYIQQGVDQLFTDPTIVLPGTEDFLTQLSALHKDRIASAADARAEDNSIPAGALTDFLTLSLDVISDVGDKLVSWQNEDIAVAEQEQTIDALGQMIDSAESINMVANVELGQSLQVLMRQAFTVNEHSDEFFVLADKGCDALIDMLDQIAAHQTPHYDPNLLDQIQSFECQASVEPELEPVVELHIETPSPFNLAAETELNSDVEPTEAGVGQCADELPTETSTEDQDQQPVPDMIAVELDSEPQADDQQANLDSAGFVAELESYHQNPLPSLDPVELDDTDVEDDEEGPDDEIVEIFIEEADELLELLDEAIHAWDNERENRAHPDEILRILHTLKGGARLAGIKTIGDLSHEFESALESLNLEKLVSDDAVMAQTLVYQDKLLALTQIVKNNFSGIDEEVVTPQELVVERNVEPYNTPLESVAVPMTTTADQQVISEGSTDDSQTFNNELTVTSNPRFAPPTHNEGRVSVLLDQKRGPQEVVKVSAQLLEDLVNLAGETSISRGRAEEQITDLVYSLEDMQTTLDRLQGQVRRLDMETEQQILYRQEQVEQEGLEGFDPLEMDRYSQLQQLSRSLLESSSDLSEIKGTLADKARDMETLLVQQSRINTELQEGLMRSRMVPFSRMVPRLRRIVRQVGAELNKKIDFRLENVEGELDRSVLERMVSPLEHMLRNAVDHGIESNDQRAAAGKPATGIIALSLAREGGDIVITLTDDGAGIDLNVIRKKAVERGLLKADAQISDNELQQFILQAGFSTAQKITQISGRGVGLDVVHSEIKLLGGTMDIDSIYGQGTQFSVRLPFTVSVNRALMVNVGGDSYAIPLNTIEGIVRVSPFELEAYYQPDAPLFEYAGQTYALRYMGALLNRGDKPILDGHSMPLPVILVKGSDHSVAIQVDSLMGSREIVVKTLGPQFSMVQGLSGATVLGDGNVVVILDLPAMIRADALQLQRSGVIGHDDSHLDEDLPTKVMVVDDSVTVRKVTSRFLERQGFEVILAKDGVDAVAQLNEMERLPDVMLLDIEMPRMDGFEVAGRVRHTQRLKDIPIIMITSRTGEKHRERAMSLGVNHYLGKPYQETILLETIHRLTGSLVE